MATLKIIIDTRTVKRDSTSPIYIRLIHHRKTINIKIGLYLNAMHWNAKQQKVKLTNPNAKRWNVMLTDKRLKAEKALLEIEDDINNKTADELKEIIIAKLFPHKAKAEKQKRFGLYEFTNKIIKELETANKHATAKTYYYDIGAFKKYLKGKEIYLDQIDYDFLKGFEAFSLGRGVNQNGVSHYMKTLRSVLNRAIKSGALYQNSYPFRFYIIRTRKSVKRAIDKKYFEKIKELTLKKESDLWHTKNYILFMFNTQGMNFKDMCLLKRKNIHEDRLVYIRRKTKRVYNLKLTKQAKEIISYYVSRLQTIPNVNRFIFPILPSHFGANASADHKMYNSALKYMNDRCNIIGELCGLDRPLTTYVIRHSWATIGKKMGIPTNVLQEALGHADLATTEAYLDCFEDKVVDEANERITT
tara:strand:+ start:786 stop:2033 length:1248 start_codon:yes stop_codon:yes gene_type:complete